MSYRKIEVNGKVFEYSVGKTHTKIRHVGVFKNEEIGTIKTQLLHNMITDEFYTEFLAIEVKPYDVAARIRGHV